jgi:hypothetical protein
MCLKWIQWFEFDTLPLAPYDHRGCGYFEHGGTEQYTVAAKSLEPP